jgi:hypothetical protein
VYRLGPLVAALIATGCDHRLVVRTTVPVPPTLPLGVYPEIAVVPGAAPEALELAQAIASHLAVSTLSRVERIDAVRFQTLRREGLLGRAAVVLHVDTRMLETTRPSFRTRPQTMCGPWGCTTQPRVFVDDIPVVVATLVLRVEEARSGRLLQELVLEEREEGVDPWALRVRVVDRLRRRAMDALDPGERVVEIELAAVDDPEVAAALDALRVGHVTEARSSLDRIVARDGFARRAPEVRAKILFDLGQARRLEARAPGISASEWEARLAEAERAIREALRLQPEAMYARALQQIAEEREARARFRAQAEAASYNFSLDGATGVPDPPPSYQSLSQ